MSYYMHTHTLTDMTELTDIRINPYREWSLRKSFFYSSSL